MAAREKILGGEVMSNGIAVREDFSGSSTTLTVQETASTAIAAQAKAMVESRYVMAMRNPRNWDQVRLDLLAECKRPAFANNKSAYYKKPIGQGVEGLGIRFVEVALRCMKNVLIETNMIFEDDQKEIHRVSVTDLESNVTYPLDVKVTKTVERSKANDDGSYISMRKNSRGQVTYTIQAQDDDLLNKRGAMISKAVRTLGLRIIPGDLCDEAEAIIKKIRLDSAAQDPGAERKRIVDAFAEIGVKAVDLVEYLGHSIEQCSPSQLVDLRGIYGAIKDGEATWKSVMDNKLEQGGKDQGKKKLPEYTDEQLEKNLPGWHEAINSGSMTADKIIAKIKSGYSLSDEQIERIKSPKKQESIDPFVAEMESEEHGGNQ